MDDTPRSIDTGSENGDSEKQPQKQPAKSRRRLLVGALVGLAFFIILALGLGLGLHFGLQSRSSSPTTTSTLAPSSNDSQANTANLDTPSIKRNFPDPCYIEVNNTYYAFGTNNFDHKKDGQINVQIAKSDDFENWEVLDKDALPNVGGWSSGQFVWAPDVVQLDDGTFVLYYTAQHINQTAKHCVHAATSENIEGPYIPISGDAWICPLSRGGAIDPEGFRDVDGSRYILYKIDGNSMNQAGQPLNPTPILLQKVGDKGYPKEGEPRQLLDRIDEDGPLIEAPALGRYETGSGKDAVYVLFYSSNVFDSENYDVSYATSNSVGGPFTRSESRLLQSGDANGKLSGPGGLDVGVNGKKVVFHAMAPGPSHKGLVRHMWTAEISVNGNNVSI